MIEITFCGHSEIIKQDILEERLFDTINNIAKNKPVTFYLGDYGSYDHLAKKCAKL